MVKIKHVQTPEVHKKNFEEELEQVKQRLKASKCKVGLKVSSAIQLQATLPPKPNSDKIKPYQQLISLGIPANLDGLKTAEEEAYELGKLLARKQFEWDEKYLCTKKDKTTPTIGELLEKFEEEYFKTRQRTISSETTFSNYLSKINKHFNKKILANQTNIENCLNTIVSPSSRYQSAASISVLCKTFGILIDVKKFAKKNYEPQNRNIPSDEQIVLNFNKFELYAKNRSRIYKKNVDIWKMQRWVYGMLATYGLRPREIFLKPDLDWWLSSENIDNTWKVHKDCKTGAREAFPLYLEWIELFDLKNSQCVSILKDAIQNKSTFIHYKNLVHKNAKWFEKVGIDFPPYDLRHAWAIRAHMLLIPVKAAADNLGHSVEMHLETYQKHFGRENRKRMINEATNKQSEMNQLKLELEQSKLENERLKLELRYAKLPS
ncbi:Phage integrase [Rivularia sp. IAM M-261]|nr:Phage integrase [Calothrix sp. PCC 7716]GJD15356.1 Phage integrase [Rivularia sp. IAM M-261]